MVAWVLLGVFVAIGFVELMDNVDRLFRLPACQFLLDLSQIGTVLVVLLQTAYNIFQILSAHPLILKGDIGVYVLLQPLRRKMECLSCKVDIGDGFTCEQATLSDELADGFCVLSGIAFEVS